MKIGSIANLHILTTTYAYLSFSSRYYFNSSINAGVKDGQVPTSESIWNLSYAPYDVACPEFDLVREANDVSYKCGLIELLLLLVLKLY